MCKFIFRLLIAALAAALLAGCASEKGSSLPDPAQSVVLEGVPYFSQRENHCGPSSLAMLLGASGVDVAPDELAPYVYLPQRQGSLQLELMAACRRWKRIPYVISPSVSSIIGELESGRPVLVLQNLGLNILPIYHYSVVIGFLAPDRLILRSGDDKRLEVDLNRFIASWQKAGSWGVVALEGGELPFRPQKLSYLRAVRDFELLGNEREAGEAYLAAITRWPGDRSVSFALGNNRLRLKKYREAEEIFRGLVVDNPGDIAALNNLAESLSIQGCPAAAMSFVDQGIVLAMQTESQFLQVLRQTRREILKRNLEQPSPRGKDCNR